MTNTFFLDYGVSGSERKRLVNAISAHTGIKAKYLGAPGFAYEVGGIHIDSQGKVSFDGSEQIDSLIEALTEQGFEAQSSCLPEQTAPAPEQAAPAAEEPTDGLTISLPQDGFTEAALENLRKLLEAKGALIQKALGADRLTVDTDEEHVSFPWWDRMPEPEEIQAYMSFVAALSAMAKEAKRVTSKEKDIESEKYAFRCFLLRLGFIGAESKAQRKLLLSRLSGSAAFPTAAEAEKFSAAQKAKRIAAKEAQA